MKELVFHVFYFSFHDGPKTGTAIGDKAPDLSRIFEDLTESFLQMFSDDDDGEFVSPVDDDLVVGGNAFGTE